MYQVYIVSTLFNKILQKPLNISLLLGFYTYKNIALVMHYLFTINLTLFKSDCNTCAFHGSASSILSKLL